LQLGPEHPGIAAQAIGGFGESCVVESLARMMCLGRIGFCPDGRREHPREIQAARPIGRHAGFRPRFVALDPGRPVRVGYGPWCPVLPRGSGAPERAPALGGPGSFWVGRLGSRGLGPAPIAAERFVSRSGSRNIRVLMKISTKSYRYGFWGKAGAKALKAGPQSSVVGGEAAGRGAAGRHRSPERWAGGDARGRGMAGDGTPRGEEVARQRGRGMAAGGMPEGRGRGGPEKGRCRGFKRVLGGARKGVALNRVMVEYRGAGRKSDEHVAPQAVIFNLSNTWKVTPTTNEKYSVSARRPSGVSMHHQR
jgi:hypothetical protein